MSRWHDPEASACRCYTCSEARYHAELAVRAEAELADETLARAEAELASRQLRLPIPGLPHAAHLPSTL